MRYSSIKKLSMAGLAFTVMCSGMFFTSQTYAQVDEIVVTAGKRVQTLQDVPIAVSVVSAETIEQAHIVDLLDLQSVVPALRITQLQSTAQTNIKIRGFGTVANNIGIEPTVAVYIDGVYRSRSGAALSDLPTIDRVEVLRGPQSTLFGKNASAGVLSITTSLPDDEFNGFAEVTFGNYGSYKLQSSITGPISDNTSIRFSFSNNRSKGYFKNLSDNSNFNERNRWAVRGQLLSHLTDDLTLRVIADYNQIDEECCGVVTLLNGTSYTNALAAVGANIVDPVNPYGRALYLNGSVDNKLIGKGISAQFDYDLPSAEVRLTSITSYRGHSSISSTDGDFTNAEIVKSNGVDDKAETWAQEFRLTSDYDGPFQWLAGVAYYNEKIIHDRNIVFGKDTNTFFRGVITQGIFQTFVNQDALYDFVTSNDFLYDKYEADGITISPTASLVKDSNGNNVRAGLGVNLSEDRAIAAAELATIINDPSHEDSGFLNATVDSIFDLISGGCDFSSGGSGCADNDAVLSSWWAEGEGVEKEGFEMDSQSLSLFTQFDYEFIEGLVGTFGMSYTLDRKKVKSDVVINDAFSQQDLGFLDGILDDDGSGSFERLSTFILYLTDNLNAVDPEAAAALSGLTSNVDRYLAIVTSFQEVDFSELSNLQAFTPYENYEDTFNSAGLSYSARLAYDVTDFMNVYISYATGWKSKAVNLSYDGRGTENFPRYADPEDAQSIEIGVKTSFDWGYINLTIFEQSIEDFQSNTFNGTGFNLVNAGELRHRGLEWDTLYRPTDSVTLTFSGILIDPEYIDFKQGPCDISGFPPFQDDCAPGTSVTDFSGKRPAGVSEVSLNLAAVYTFEVGNNIGGFVRGEFIYESEVQVEDNVLASIASREVKTINASIGLSNEDAGWKVLLWGRNLTEDNYLRSTFPFPISPDTFLGYASEPRTFGVSIKQSF